VERIEPQSLGLSCPGLVDELVGREAAEGLEPAAEVVGAHEVGEMGLELPMALVVVALDGGFLDGAVHTLGLTDIGMMGFALLGP
jgi:hypothetical protein